MIRLLLVLSCLYLVDAGYKRVCYYDSWARYRRAPNHLPAANINPDLCTHLIFSFVNLDNVTFQLEPDVQGDEEEYGRFTNLKAKNPYLVTMIAVGGWGQGTASFRGLVETPERMASFANGTVEFLRKYGFDGLDIDWEYPGIRYRGGRPSDKQKFVDLLNILRETFDNEVLEDNQKTLLISTAVATTDNYIIHSYNVTEIAKNVDFINMMFYDFHGDWEDTANVHSALYGNDGDLSVDAHVHSWIAHGAPASKILLGMPLYGHAFTLTNTSDQSVGASISKGRVLAYYQLCHIIQNRNLQEHVLTTERVPYIVYEDQWVGYDNQQSVEEKARYAVSMGLGGTMVWAVGLDDSSGGCGQGSYPLLRAIKAGLSPEVGPVGK